MKKLKNNSEVITPMNRLFEITKNNTQSKKKKKMHYDKNNRETIILKK